MIILTAVLIDRFGSFDTGTSQNVLERVLARQKAEDRLRRNPRVADGNNGGPSIEFDEPHSGGMRRAGASHLSSHLLSLRSNHTYDSHRVSLPQPPPPFPAHAPPPPSPALPTPPTTAPNLHPSRHPTHSLALGSNTTPPHPPNAPSPSPSLATQTHPALTPPPRLPRGAQPPALGPFSWARRAQIICLEGMGTDERRGAPICTAWRRNGRGSLSTTVGG